MMKRLLILLLVPFSAHAFELEVPVACEINKECFIQNYVDTDPGPAYADYQCGKLVYDNHDGTDFRLKNFVVMQQGVNVVAAAPGKVLGTRDGVEDTGVDNPDNANKECGNGVLLEHEGGWQTQYCHMKKGSVKVAKGQQVKTGDVLGSIGYSGQTEFPHLHFSVRHNGKKIDPFTGKEALTALCNGELSGSIWSKAAQATLRYDPTHLLGMGLSSQQPDTKGIRRGKFNESELHPDAPYLIVWVDVMGVLAGDRLKLQLLDPNGVSLLDKEEIFAKPKAIQFYYAGRKLQGSKWPLGTYTGKAWLYREGKQVFSAERSLMVRP